MKKVYAPGNDDMGEYPSWICSDCGLKAVSGRRGCSTWQTGICGWCGQEKAVTQPRDFGYPRWEKK